MKIVGTLLIAVFVLIASPKALAFDPAEQGINLESSQAWVAYDERIQEARSNMMGAPGDALTFARDAEAVLGAVEPSDQKTEAIANALWLQAEALNRTNAPDSARPVVERALEMLELSNLEPPVRADLILTRGRIAQQIGDVQAAFESYLDAHEAFTVLGNKRKQGIALQKVGDIYNDAGDYERAITYYDDALSAYDADPRFTMVTHNNRANALRGLARYDEAASHYEEALAEAASFNSPMLNARILNNLAGAQLLAGEVDAADETAEIGLDQMPEGEASGWEPFLWGVKAQVAYSRGNLRQAAALISRTFADQDLETTIMPFRDFHETAYQIYGDLGRESLAFSHLLAFKRLEDEAVSVRASANAALMAAQFDNANQRLQIEGLRRDQLERDIEIAQARERQRSLLIGFLTFASLLIVGFLTAGYISVRNSRDAIRKVNDNLNQTNLELERANKAKTEFLATTSHEIRTPLNGILGMASVLMEERELDGTVRDKVRVVQSAGKSMKAIVDDLLDVAKIETGNITLDPEPCDIGNVLDEVAILWRDTAEQKGLEFKSELEGDLGQIMTDELRFRQVIFNLLSNGVKFTDEGSVSLIARSEGQADDRKLVIAVQDTGIGIPEDELDQVFKAFHQVDGTKTRRHSGAGLGLSIVRNFVEPLGGTIDVSSEVGKGTRFELTLPAVRLDEPKTEQSEDAPHTPATSVETSVIAIVQPDFMQKMVFEAFFSDEVGRVIMLDSAEELSDLIASESFDVGILSIDDGEQARTLSESARAKEIKLIGQSETIRPELANLFDKVLVGEFEPDDILVALKLLFPNEDKPQASEGGFGETSSSSAA